MATYSVKGFVQFVNGNFVAFVRRGMQWLKCDDSKVTEMKTGAAIWPHIIFLKIPATAIASCSGCVGCFKYVAIATPAALVGANCDETFFLKRPDLNEDGLVILRLMRLTNVRRPGLVL